MERRQINDTPGSVIAVLLLAVWLLATPFCLLMANLGSMELFGEQPSSEQMTEAWWWFAAAIVSGVGVPVLGLGLARGAGGWRAGLFGGALVLSTAALLGGMVFTLA